MIAQGQHISKTDLDALAELASRKLNQSFSFSSTGWKTTLESIRSGIKSFVISRYPGGLSINLLRLFFNPCVSGRWSIKESNTHTAFGILPYQQLAGKSVVTQFLKGITAHSETPTSITIRASLVGRIIDGAKLNYDTSSYPDTIYTVSFRLSLIGNLPVDISGSYTMSASRISVTSASISGPSFMSVSLVNGGPVISISGTVQPGDYDVTLTMRGYVEGIFGEVRFNGSATSTKTIQINATQNQFSTRQIYSNVVPIEPPEIKVSYLTADGVSETTQVTGGVTFESPDKIALLAYTNPVTAIGCNPKATNGAAQAGDERFLRYSQSQHFILSPTANLPTPHPPDEDYTGNRIDGDQYSPSYADYFRAQTYPAMLSTETPVAPFTDAEWAAIKHSKIYSITAVRVKPLDSDYDAEIVDKSNSVTVGVGIKSGGRFTELESITIPSGKSGATIYPDRLIFSNLPIAFDNDKVNIHAVISTPMSAPVLFSDGQIQFPIIAAHYNDVEAVLNAI